MNTAISAEQLLRQLQWRYATKQFDPSRKVSDADWAALEEAVLLSPSSFGLQPYQFLVARDPVLRKRLQLAAFNQTQIVDASHLVIFAAKNNLSEASIDAFLQRIAQVRQVQAAKLAAFRDTLMNSLIEGMDAAARLEWARYQTYIALGNLLTSAALLGLDACPMEGFDHGQFNEILGLRQKGLAATVLAAVGYR